MERADAYIVYAFGDCYACKLTFFKRIVFNCRNGLAVILRRKNNILFRRFAYACTDIIFTVVRESISKPYRIVAVAATRALAVDIIVTDRVGKSVDENFTAGAVMSGISAVFAGRVCNRQNVLTVVFSAAYTALSVIKIVADGFCITVDIAISAGADVGRKALSSTRR